MSSLLSHSRLKLWVWIIIIVAGSLVLLSSMCVVGWWCARRIRARRKLPSSPVLAPTRKVTIRRGRMVSSSRYLSLTGSQFGLGQFMNMEEKDQGEKGRSRSKSPFMWWMSNIQDRSQSQQSHALSHQQMEEVESQHSYHRPEPAFCNDRHAHKESVSSDYSLPSIINGRELAEDARVTPLPMSERRSNSPRNDRYVNFSRAFSPLHQSALSSPLGPKVLSQIVESSPRHSTVSKHTSFVSAKEVVISVEEEAVPATTIPHPAPVPRAPPTSHSVPDDLQRSSKQQNTPLPRFSFTNETSFSPSTLEQVVSTTQSVPKNKTTISHLPASPLSGPLPPPPRRTYVDEDSTPPLQYGGTTITTTTRSYASEKQPSTDALHVINPNHNHPREPTQSQSSSTNGAFTSLPSITATTMRLNSRSNPNSYWSSRPDLQPVPLPVPLPIRKPSKKGNVLRKKSLKRAEIVSWVGT